MTSIERVVVRHPRVTAAVAVLFGGLGALPATAFALGGPSPGAVSAQTVKLPSSPGSVRGLADNAAISGFTGQVEYAVPIELPAGPGGIAPSLSLGYDGGLGNGPLGVGWALSQPGIRRSVRLGVPSYTAIDEFELVGLGGGGQLVALATGAGIEYRAEGQGNSITGRAIDGGFELIGPDGKVYRFGTTAAGRKASGPRVAFWYLEQIRDVAGQTIDYHYRQDRGEVYLDSIAWGPVVGTEPAFRAELVYESRTDAVVSYRTGFRVESAQRLAQIRIWSFGAISRVTALDYEGAFALSRLHGVRLTSADGVDAMPPLTFSYAAPLTGGVTPVPDVTGWTLNQQGTSLFDVDGDGAMDLLRLQPTGHSYRRNLGGRFDTPRPIPGAAGASLEQVRLLDLTGDSGAELVWQQGSQWSVFQLTGDPANRAWASLGSLGGAQNLSLSSVTVADVNGDYLMDVLSVSGSSVHVRFGTLTGLAAPVLRSAIDPLRSFIAPGNVATSFPDINGDGLADAVYLSTTSMFLYLGRGDGTFERYRDLAYPWTGTVPNAAIRLGDLNRDGLLDVAVVRAGNVEWYRGLCNGALDTVPVRVTRPAGTDASVVVALADANGNGSEDLVWSSDAGMWVLDLAGPTSAGMLLGIDNGLGQSQSFRYDASAQLALAAAASGAPWSTTMPISIPVTSSERLTFASGDPARSMRLDVRDGIYDRSERRFVGFAQSTLTRPDPADGAPPEQTTRTIQRFATGLGAERVLRGQVVHERIEDGTGKLYRETTNTLAALAVDGLPAAEPRLRRVAVLQTVARRFEGADTPVDIRTRYLHDGEGRVIEEAADGRIDLAGDESIRRTTYTAADPVTRVRDKICQEEVLGAGGASAGKSRRLFGDAASVAPLCQPGKGWVREEQGYLSDGDRWVTQKRTAYDAAGNATSVFAGGVTRQIGYDGYRQFAVSETVSPAAGQTLSWQLQWDIVQGKPRQLSAPDGAVTTATYDGLGRLIAIADGSSPPHTHYRYRWAGPRPRTETFTFDGDPSALGALPATWTPGAGWRHSVEITNSAGEPWLAAVQLDTARWIISGLRARDVHGRTTSIANPFYADGADPATLALPANPPAQTAVYDALDRPVLQALPSGSQKRIAYSPLGISTTTDGLAPVQMLIDGLGRTIRTERTVSGVVESVDATYDAAGRVLRFRLQNSQVDHSFTYDTLGRLVHAYDPDIGTRTMRYDDGGALIHSVNGAGEEVGYTYDGAGRLTSVTADGAPVRFHYDQPRSAGYSFTAGRLAWVEEATGTVDLGYDAHGRRTVFHRSIVDGSVTTEATQTQRLSPSGLLLGLSFDDGVSLPLAYDPAGRVVGVGSEWAVDELNASGDVLRERFGNGVVQSYERDVQRLPTRVRVARPAQALYDVAIGHGPFGAISSVADGDGAGLDHTASFAYDGGGRLTTASIGAAGPAQFQFSFAYDGLQNMIRRTVSGPTALGVLAGRYDYAGGGPRQLSRVARPDGTTLATFAYDAAGRQTQHAGMTMRYNALSQLIRVDGLPGGASVEHRYGYEGERVITRDARGVSSYWLTPDLIESGGVRDHYVRVNGRTLARISLGAGSTASAAAGVTHVLTGALRGVAAAIVAALLLSLAASLRRRGRRPLWVVRASHVALVALVAPGCTGGGVGQLASAVTWQTNRKLYFHQGVSMGPTLITDAAGMVYEERRYEPFGEAIDAYREGSGVTAVDYRREAMNSLNKPSDPDTDLSYHGARWLPTDTAQWLTPDPPVKAPSAKFLLSPWSLHPYQYVEQNPIAFWDPDGKQPDLIDLTIPDAPIANKTFATADVSRLRDFFVRNAANPAPAGGTSGNTDPTKRYSCIGTMNHGIEKLFDKNLWKGNGLSEVDKTQDKMISKGKTLGENKVKYTWDSANKEAKTKGSDWDTVINMANGDQGWSVYLVSIAGGYHSVTVTLDNRDTANPTIIFSDQNGGSEGWRKFSTKASFDAFMKDWQTSGGKHYTDPNRDPYPLKHPPVGARYVRLRPDD
jgi:RHS repeat-associated protein